MSFGSVNYVILFLYLAGMVGIGLFFARGQRSGEDYFLAGRKMPWLVVGMSMFASLTSAVTYMGVPGIAYSDNVAIIFGVMVSPIVAPILIVTFYPIYRKLNVSTSYEYILYRYGRGARYAVSGLFVLSRLGWLGTVIFAPALALSTVTGIDIRLAILLMGVLATAYTALGGLSAVLWTDVVQFVILLGGAVWVAVSLANNVDGGIGAIFETAREAGRFDVFYWRLDIYKMTATAAAVSWFFMFMQDYGTDQITVQRLLSVKDLKGMARAVVFNSINDVLIIAVLLFIGIGLFSYYNSGASVLEEGVEADRMLAYYIINELPVGVSGLLVTAIFAAAMSSMDSGINSVSSVIVNDFVKPMRREKISGESEVRLGRYLTVLLGVFATGVAFYAASLESIVEAWSSFISLFSGPVLAIFVLGIFFRRANFYGWLAGAVLSIGATFWVQKGTGVHWVYYFPFSFAVNLIAAVVISLVVKGPLAGEGLCVWKNAER